MNHKGKYCQLCKSFKGTIIKCRGCKINFCFNCGIGKYCKDCYMGLIVIDEIRIYTNNEIGYPNVL